MHSCSIVHRDIKPQNILVNSDCQVRVCDFGLARSLPESVLGKHNGQSQRVRHSVLTKLTGKETEEEKRELIVKKVQLIRKQGQKCERSVSPHVQSRWFRAPEVILLAQRYDQAIDIWSVGCILLEMLQSMDYCSSLLQETLLKGHSSFPLSPGCTSVNPNT